MSQGKGPKFQEKEEIGEKGKKSGFKPKRKAKSQIANNRPPEIKIYLLLVPLMLFSMKRKIPPTTEVDEDREIPLPKSNIFPLRNVRKRRKKKLKKRHHRVGEKKEPSALNHKKAQSNSIELRPEIVAEEDPDTEIKFCANSISPLKPTEPHCSV